MTVDNMLTLLGYRLDDPTSTRYTSAVKLRHLNDEAEHIAGLVHTGFLRDLQDNTDFNASATGNILPNNYFRYISSKLRSVNPEKWVTKVHMEDLSVFEDNQYSRGSDLDPICYLWGSNIYVLINTYSGTADDVRMYFIKTPTPMAVGGDCYLHRTLHMLLIDATEAMMRLTYKHGDPVKQMEKYEVVHQKLEVMNSKIIQGEIL